MNWRIWSVASLMLLPASQVGRSDSESRLSFGLRDPEVFQNHTFEDLLTQRSIDPDVRITVASAKLNGLVTPARLHIQGATQSDPRLSSLALVISSEGLKLGMDPKYLVELANRESHFDSFAQSPTSTASGLFQFTKNTWLCALRTYGPALGVTGSQRIQRNRSGACVSATPEEQDWLLALRSNVKLSSRIAAATSVRNYEMARGALGRAPTAAELYALHFFGEGVGLSFIRAVAESPSLPAFRLSQAAARANPTLFFAKDGSPISVGQLYETFKFQ